ncbi:hypothetical protein FA15DRAFT_672639 [Coprinopsis marcescibilis]|uniref:F-box domain-containing protein n=1 Tax=Coprinopsis marcescibilis TaxID=230819 RepID=A0A5C3KM49_COPMA|nr:hypothetical protein FA15DRAFT_672639 [Coprinopsis marcescibilis]
MHRVFQIQELCCLIFSMLEKNHLAVLARTCSMFHEPAIQIIWRDLCDILPIFYVLYPGPEAPTFGKKRGRQELITQEIVDRLVHYARHVRSLDYQPTLCRPSKHIRDRYDLYTLQNSKRIPSPLFPNLRKATLPTFPAIAEFYASLVLAPSVQSINLYAGGLAIPVPDWGAISHILQGRVGSLVSFTAQPNDSFNGTRCTAVPSDPSLDRLLDQLSSSLHSLDVTSVKLDIEPIISLSQLPNLSHLRMSILRSQSYAFDPWAGSTSLAFSALSEAVFMTDSLEILDGFLSQLRAPGLRSLDIQCTRSNDTRSLDTLISTIARMNPSQLEQLSIQDMGDIRTLPIDELDIYQKIQFSLTADSLKQLTAFRRMSSLRISPCSTSRLQDLDLHRLLSAWPDLKTFCLPDETLREAPAVSLDGVQRAVQLCPSLEVLALRFGDAAGASVGQPYSDGLPRLSLKEWNVGTSAIRSGREFGEWVKTRYPKLERLRYFEGFRKAVDQARCYGDDLDAYVGRSERLSSAVGMLERWKVVKDGLGLVA